MSVAESRFLCVGFRFSSHTRLSIRSMRQEMFGRPTPGIRLGRKKGKEQGSRRKEEMGFGAVDDLMKNMNVEHRTFNVEFCIKKGQG